MEEKILDTMFSEFKDSLKKRWDFLDTDHMSMDIHFIPAKEMPSCSAMTYTEGVGNYLIKSSKKQKITLYSKTINLD